MKSMMISLRQHRRFEGHAICGLRNLIVSTIRQNGICVWKSNMAKNDVQVPTLKAHTSTMPEFCRKKRISLMIPPYFFVIREGLYHRGNEASQITLILVGRSGHEGYQCKTGRSLDLPGVALVHLAASIAIMPARAGGPQTQCVR